jgi:hypothetical protein
VNKDKIELIGGGEIVFDGGTNITSTEVELPSNGKLTFGKFEISVEGEDLIFKSGEKRFVVTVEKEKEKEKENENEKWEGKITEDT